MEDVRDEPPPLHLGDYPNGAYWSAERGRSAGDCPDDSHSISGHVIRFMWDYSVRVPLWDAGGLLPEEPEWLRVALGLSDELIDALTDWGREMSRLDGTRWEDKTRTEWEQAYRDMDVRARVLVERLRRELGTRYEVTYDPW